MRSRNEVRASLVLLLVAATASVLVTSCGGGSDSEIASGGQPSSGGTANTAGDKSSSGSSKGGSSSSGSGSGSGSNAGSPGSTPEGGSGNDPGPGEDCEAQASWTEAMHYALDVTWPGTTAGEEGMGKIHIWSRVTFSANGDDLEVGLHACGSVLPETNLTVAGQFATGGKKVLIEVPSMVWDAPSIPITMATGTQSGFAVGSDVELSYVSVLGATLADPLAAWPESGADMTAVDLEGDSAKGYTAAPKDGGGYVLPPTAVGLAGSAPSADKVYLVSRQAMTLKGKRTACDAHSGTAEVTAFDNHVVGCHIKGAAECSAGQSDFVDENRMRYMVTSATYEAKTVATDTSCADVRAALPQ
jgi:hypothetical protein